MNSTKTVLLCLLLAAPSAALSAQALPQVGDLIRGREDGRLVQGRLVETPFPGSPLRVALTPGNAPFDLSWDAPALSYRVRRSQKLQSALIGFAAGAATGALLGFASGDDTCTGWCFFAYSAEEKAFLGALLLGSAGAVLGAITGSGSVWAPINRPVEPRRVGLQLSAQGAGLRIAF